MRCGRIAGRWCWKYIIGIGLGIDNSVLSYVLQMG